MEVWILVIAYGKNEITKKWNGCVANENARIEECMEKEGENYGNRIIKWNVENDCVITNTRIGYKGEWSQIEINSQS